MIVGILKEIKAEENRVSMTPAGVEVMTHNGHELLVEKNAGVGSGFDDAAYVRALRSEAAGRRQDAVALHRLALSYFPEHLGARERRRNLAGPAALIGLQKQSMGTLI